MATLKRVGPGSAFKVGLALYGFVGLILGLILSLVSMLGGALPPTEQDSFLRMFFGAGAVIILPLIYGVVGGIMGAISAAFYNLIAGWFGGLEVDIS